MLIAEGRNYLSRAWWLTAAPGFVVVLVVLSADRISRSIYAKHAASRANKLSGKERNVAGATSHIQHSHAFSQPGFSEYKRSQGTEKPGLLFQPAKLVLGMTEDVIRLF